MFFEPGSGLSSSYEILLAGFIPLNYRMMTGFKPSFGGPTSRIL